jgi:cellulose biosynthesis protein BcsQ
MKTNMKHRSNVISIGEFFNRKGGSGKSFVTIGSAILAAAVNGTPELQFAVISLGNTHYDYGIYDMLPQLVGAYENPTPDELDAIITAIIDSREEYPEPNHLYLMIDTPPLLPVKTAERLHDTLQRIETDGANVGVTAVVYPGYGLRDCAA